MHSATPVENISNRLFLEHSYSQHAKVRQRADSIVTACLHSTIHANVRSYTKAVNSILHHTLNPTPSPAKWNIELLRMNNALEKSSSSEVCVGSHDIPFAFPDDGENDHSDPSSAHGGPSHTLKDPNSRPKLASEVGSLNTPSELWKAADSSTKTI